MLIHVYHVKGQLAHKYPEAMGGVYYVPKNWKDAETKIHENTPQDLSLMYLTTKSKVAKKAQLAGSSYRTFDVELLTTLT